MKKWWKKDTDSAQVATIFTPKCNHTWQDFPWYITQSFSDGTSEIEIMEPYVCIHCGERMNKTLSYRKSTMTSINDHYKRIRETEEKFSDQLKPQAIVEDMIFDMMYVDREKLENFKKYKEGIDKDVPTLQISRNNPQEA